MAPISVAVLDDYQQAARNSPWWKSLEDRASVTYFSDHLSDEDAVADRLAPYQVVFAMRERTPFPRSLLVRLPELQLLVTTAMANVAIDVAAARELGVTVSGTAAIVPPTGELAWALILSLVRHIPQEDAAIRAGRWQTTTGTDLAGATLGVVGLGKVGRQVARVAQAFDMKVLAWSQNLDTASAAAAGVTAVTKEQLFSHADIVTIHLKSSGRNRGIVGRMELSSMRPGAFLVNTSRAPLVDEDALVDLLQAGHLGGAALDVFNDEPLAADHRLRGAPRTLLTPHIGYVTANQYEVFFRDAVDDVHKFLDGAPVRVMA